MTGLVFTMLLGEVSGSSLNTFLQECGFIEVGDGAGWRADLEEEGYAIKVFVKYEEGKVKFLLPEPSVPAEINERVVRRIASELYEHVHGVEMPPEKLKVEAATYSFCYYCLKPVRELLFRCRRCGGRYCSQHRLPERHKCPGISYVKAAFEGGEKREPEAKREMVVKRHGGG